MGRVKNSKESMCDVMCRMCIGVGGFDRSQAIAEKKSSLRITTTADLLMKTSNERCFPSN